MPGYRLLKTTMLCWPRERNRRTKKKIKKTWPKPHGRICCKDIAKSVGLVTPHSLSSLMTIVACPLKQLTKKPSTDKEHYFKRITKAIEEYDCGDHENNHLVQMESKIQQLEWSDRKVQQEMSQLRDEMKEVKDNLRNQETEYLKDSY